MNFLRRLNDLPLFVPSWWPKRELLARICGTVLVAAFIGWKTLQLPGFPGVIHEVAGLEAGFRKALSFLPPGLVSPRYNLEDAYQRLGYGPSAVGLLWVLRLAVWTLETGILAGYILAFLTRGPARSVAKGFMQVVYPVIVAGLPMIITLTPLTFDSFMPANLKAHFIALTGILLLLILGGALNLVGLLTLRRSFSLMSEARTLIRSGPYRLIRHPLYAGHFVVFLGYTIQHLQPLTVAIYVAFVAAQTLRARIEEGKLAAAFPEYAEYRRSTGMFFPRLRRVPMMAATTHERS